MYLKSNRTKKKYRILIPIRDGHFLANMSFSTKIRSNYKVWYELGTHIPHTPCKASETKTNIAYRRVPQVGGRICPP